MERACDRYGRTTDVQKVRISVSIEHDDKDAKPFDLYLETKDLCKEGRDNLVRAIERYTSPPVKRKTETDEH